MSIAKIILSALASLTLAVTSLFAPKPHIAMTQTPLAMQQVLGAATQSAALQFNVNVPAVFNDTVTFNKNISAPNIVTSVQGSAGTIAFTAGSGITLDGLKITNSGITALTAGTGISVSGSTITNSDLGSSQNIFKNMAVSGQTTVAAGSNSDTLTFVAGTGLAITTDSTNKKLTFTPDFTTSGWTLSGTYIYPTTLTNSVGIGTKTPTTPLYVLGASTLAGAVTLGSASTDSLTFTGRVKNGTSLLPDTDLGSDLGASGSRFNNLWVANINSNSSQSFSGQTTFSYPPTNTTIAQASVLINPTTSATDGQLLGLGLAGYERALIDAEGDIILGYNSATSAPATAYPLTIYGHSGTNVAYVDASGNLALAGGAVVKPLSDSTSALNIANSSGTSFVTFDTTNSRVGIGTTTPGSLLAIGEGSAGSYGSQTTTPTGLLVKGSTVFENSGNGTYLSFSPAGYQANGTLKFGYAEGDLSKVTNLTFNVSNSSSNVGFVSLQMNSDNSVYRSLSLQPTGGNVGIGTTGPGELFSVNASTAPRAVIGAGRTTHTQLYAPYNGQNWTSLDINSNSSNIAGLNLVTSNGTSAITFDDLGAGTEGTNDLRLGQIASTRDGAANSGYIAFSTSNAGTISEKMRIDHAGNVGIGTTSPGAIVHVLSPVQNVAFTASGVENKGLTLDTGYGSGNGAWGHMGITFIGDAGTNGWSGIYQVHNAVGSSQLAFVTSGSERVRIDNNGKVGIGNISPSATLDVTGTINASLGFWSGGKASAGISGSVLQFGDIGSNNLSTALYAGSSERMRIDTSGNVGIGTTAPTSLLHVNGAVTGKALAMFNETGDQALLTASASGTTKFTVLHNGLVNATAGGLATYTKAGTISDTDFTDTAVNGLMGFDSTDGRLYIRNGGLWSYIAKTAGFQIPNTEAYSYNQATKSFDTSQPLQNGDFLMPFVEKHLSDGGLHGLYTSFTSAKPLLFATEDSQIASLSAQLAGIQTNAITYATATDLSTTNALVATIQTTLNTLVSQVSSLASTVSSLVVRVTTLENQTQTGVATIPGGKKGVTVTFAHAFPVTPLVVVSGATLPHYTLSVAATSFTLTFDSAPGSDTVVTWVASVQTVGTTSTSFDSAPTPAPPAPMATPTTPVSPTQAPNPSTAPTGTPAASPSASPTTPAPSPTLAPSLTPTVSPAPSPTP